MWALFIHTGNHARTHAYIPTYCIFEDFWMLFSRFMATHMPIPRRRSNSWRHVCTHTLINIWSQFSHWLVSWQGKRVLAKSGPFIFFCPLSVYLFSAVYLENGRKRMWYLWRFRGLVYGAEIYRFIRNKLHSLDLSTRVWRFLPVFLHALLLWSH